MTDTTNTQNDTHLVWNDNYRATYALTLRQFGAGRPDLGGWVAVLTGSNERFGYARSFLPKAWPLRYDKHAVAAIDFSSVRPGDILEISVAHSRNHNDARDMIVVTHIDAAGLTYRTATKDDIKSLLRKEPTA